MDLLSRAKQLLAKPFPQEESFGETIGIVTAISVFVTMFLYIFRPFGVHQWQSGMFLLCLGFGLVTFFSSLVYEALIRLLKIKGVGAQFTYGRWIIYFIGVMVFISLANFLFVRIALIGHIDWSLYPYMARSTFAIGFFPIAVLGAMALMRQEKKYQDIAKQINQHQRTTPKLQDDAARFEDVVLFDLPSRQIRYIEAMQNYIKIGWVNAQGQLEEKTQRATLKSVVDEFAGVAATEPGAEQLGGTLVRCHRSFLVNQHSIQSISGNAQGLMLALHDCDKQIPVSRSYVSLFRR